QSVFGGDLQMATFADYASDEMPISDGYKDKIMHAYLKGDSGIELMLSDTPDGMGYEEGARISLAVSSDDEPAARALWDKLAEGGTVTVPLDKSPWGSIFGMFKDKFGVSWMLDIGEMQ